MKNNLRPANYEPSFEDLVKNYNEVNEVLNKTFFDGRFSFAQFYLDIEGDLLEEIADNLGCEAGDVIKTITSVVSPTLAFNTSLPFQFHDNAFENWDKISNPPFTALLCAVSLAAENMGASENVSPNNYYVRLFELLGIEDESLQKNIKSNFKRTRVYWKALNRWLNDYDGNLGLPTAQKINNFEYVSYAMSQARVRDADRANLHKMFTYFKLSPGEYIPPAEFYAYVSEWAGLSYSSKSLKNLWKIRGLDEIIADTASKELLTWTGSGEEEQGPRASKRIIVGAQYVGFPAKLQFFVAAQSDDLQAGRTLRINELGASDGGKKAFEKNSEVLLNTCIIPGTCRLEPAPDISLDAFLLGDVVLDSGEDKFARRSRAIIPLRKDETGAFFSEVSRVSLLSEHIILCHKNSYNAVLIYLKKYARPGYKEISNSLSLPTSWAAFSGVEILTSPENESDNLQALVPLAESSISTNGGLRLAKNIWHASVPLEVIAAVSDKEFTLKLEGDEQEDQQLSPLKIPSSSGCAILKIEPSQIRKNASYHCFSETDSGVVSRQPLSFRDADKPMRHAPRNDFVLSYHLSKDRPLSTLSAQKIECSYHESLNAITGIGTHFSFAAACDDVEILSPGDDRVAGNEDVSQRDYDLSTKVGITENCTARGYHIWQCQPFEKGENRNVERWMHCKDCEQTVYSKKGRRIAGVQIKKNYKDVPPREKTEFKADTVFDAICFLGHGPWNRLLEVCSFIEGKEWSVSEYLRNLVALGHINMSLDTTSRPVEWSVAPPHLVTISPREAYLAGFRSQGFLDKLRNTAEEHGIEFIIEEQANAPDRVAVRGDISKLSSNLESIQDPLGRKLFVVENLDWRLASNCPVFSAVETALEPIHLEKQEGSSLEKFNPRTGWEKVEHDVEPGAYRTINWGTAYYFLGRDTKRRRASYDVVKLLAARDQNVRLHKYDKDSGAFVSALGCPVPGAYERALICSSGSLPVKDGNRMIYRAVNEKVGSTIINLLYT